jgi:hypothetical protein
VRLTEIQEPYPEIEAVPAERPKVTEPTVTYKSIFGGFSAIIDFPDGRRFVHTNKNLGALKKVVSSHYNL